MEFDAALGMRDNLVRAGHEKAKIEILLRNGAALAGVVGEVGTHNVVLTSLADRDYFDALVCLDEIASIQTQVRRG